MRISAGSAHSPPSQGTILPVGIDIGGGVHTVETPRSMTQGTLSQTGNDLDLAITGEGFFKILMPDGTNQYTRDGTMTQDGTQGRIVNAQGNPLQPTITIPQNSLRPHRQRPGPGVGDAAGIDSDLVDHRPDQASPASSTRPGCSRSANNLFHRHAGIGRAAGRSRQHRRLRLA